MMTRKSSNEKRTLHTLRDEDLAEVNGGYVNCTPLVNLKSAAEAAGDSGWAAFYGGALAGAGGACRYY